MPPRAKAIPDSPGEDADGKPLPTPAESHMFYTLVKNMKTKPEIDWDAVAIDNNFKNADTAKVRELPSTPSMLMSRPYLQLPLCIYSTLVLDILRLIYLFITGSFRPDQAQARHGECILWGCWRSGTT